MTKDEVLCRAWIECDPNRAGNEPGSGFHPDDTIGPLYKSSSDGGGVEVITPLTGKPVWHWFKPRAEALEEFIGRHGFKIVPAE